MRLFQHFLVAVACLVAAASCGAGASTVPDTSAESAPIDVLFVGNSYTYYNDMPEMIEEIAKANGATIDATVIAPGGYFLSDHVRDGNVARELASGGYDVVVFQEQSVAPSLLNELQTNTIPAATQLDAVADAAGTRVIWYQTWGRENGSVDFGFASYDTMQAALIQGYAQIAQATNGEVATVGESWQRIRRSGADLDLYDSDASHPTALGSYAAAIEITETLLRVQVQVAPAVSGVNETQAAAIVALG